MGGKGKKTWLVDCGSLPSPVLSKSALLPLLPPPQPCSPTCLFSLCITLSQFLTLSLAFTFSHPPSQPFFLSPLHCPWLPHVYAYWQHETAATLLRLSSQIKPIKVTSQVSLCEAKDLILVSPFLRQAFNFHIFIYLFIFYHFWWMFPVTCSICLSSFCWHHWTTFLLPPFIPFSLFLFPLSYLSLTSLKHTTPVSIWYQPLTPSASCREKTQWVGNTAALDDWHT